MGSREASFLLNNWVFIAILMVVFWGTLFPVFSEALTGNRIAVGPVFFNTMNAPLALLLLFLTGVGPLVAWRRASLANLRRQFVWPVVCGVAAAVALGVTLGSELSFYAICAWSLAAFVIGTITQEYARAIRARTRKGENPLQALGALLRRNQQRYGGYIRHLGLAFILIGLTGAAPNGEKPENV